MISPMRIKDEASREKKERQGCLECEHFVCEPANVGILVGGLAGWLASLVVRGGGLGLIGDVLVGVIGAFLGGFLLSQVFPSLYAFTGGFTGFSIGSLIVAFLGAVVLLLITRLFTARHGHTGGAV